MRREEPGQGPAVRPVARAFVANLTVAMIVFGLG
jgi:hypothetical protein